MRCAHCKRPIGSETDECAANRLVHYPDHAPLPAVPYEDADTPPFLRREARCPGCFVRWGEHHHPGCEFEVCPRCREPLMGCECGKP